MGDSQAQCHKLKLMMDDTEMRVDVNVINVQLLEIKQQKNVKHGILCESSNINSSTIY